MGLACVPEDTVADALAGGGGLEAVLEPWCEPFQG